MRTYRGKTYLILNLVATIVVLITGCVGESNWDQANSDGKNLLEELTAEQTAITFSNDVTVGRSFNYFKWEYAYNGGGVSVCDFNNDGLLDIYFVGNQVKDRIYQNLGDMKFADVTPEAINATRHDWRTGVSFADVNSDGLMDIYVCRSGFSNIPDFTSNLLFISKGGFKFEEMASEFGLADTSHSTQAAFLDYDLDGDLDVYVMNHPNYFNAFISKDDMQRHQREGTGSRDRLYQNNNGKFTDVSDIAGIWNHAYGLGISVGDVNDDGWPDIYISNDYDLGDQFWINQKDGTFMDEVSSRVKHTSNSGMGTDMADFNNDGALDIVQMDMAYSDHVRSKMNMPSMSTQRFRSLVAIGHHFQYMHNTLQMNIGNGVFSEIAHMAKVAKTDWSWSALFADIDLDGRKDLWITNGYKLDARNQDSQNKMAELELDRESTDYEEALKLIPKTLVPNIIYRNDGNLKFSSVEKDWGVSSKLSSNGAAYADLDNDGDLDLVINNLDTLASIIENSASESKNWLGVELIGNQSNPKGIGARVTVIYNNESQVNEIQATRGFQSSMDCRALFGLNEIEKVDRIEVDWPNGLQSVLNNPELNKYHQVNISSALKQGKTEIRTKPHFVDRTEEFPFKFRHKENVYDDFENEVLIPHRQSRHGPTLAKADVNGDGFEDIFIGGAAGHTGNLLLHQANGSFKPSSVAVFEKDKDYEDTGSLFFDADGDGDQDLLVVSGGIAMGEGSPFLNNGLYLNDGQGNFDEAENTLPDLRTSGMSASASDIDGDGDLDLFVGGRVSAQEYPRHPRSAILRNNGGQFEDATGEVAPGVERIGMVTRSEFADVDADGDEDLIIVGEFMPVTIFINDNGKLSKANSNGLEGTEGWWFGLEVLDLDGDGDLDIVGGNLGLNHKFKAKPEKPFNVYAGDFDSNGKTDIVLSQFQGKHNYPVRGRECSSEQMPSITQKFPTYSEFAVAEVDEIYGSEITDSLHLKVHSFASAAFINDGKGNHTRHELPREAQVAPIMAFESIDFNKDGIHDLICAGNFFDTEVETTRHDASYGHLLQGNGDGTFKAIPYSETGLFIPGNVRNMIRLDFTENRLPLLIVGNNTQPMQVIQIVE